MTTAASGEGNKQKKNNNVSDLPICPVIISTLFTLCSSYRMLLCLFSVAMTTPFDAKRKHLSSYCPFFVQMIMCFDDFAQREQFKEIDLSMYNLYKL